MHGQSITNSGMIMKARKPLLRLELWHGYDRAIQGDRTLEFALSHWTCVWIFFPWHLSDDPDGTPQAERKLYRDTLARLQEVYNRHAPSRNHEAFVKEACEILDPMVDAWLEECHRHPRPERPTFGCFGYAVDPAQPSMAALHFHNACWPCSPFENQVELVDDLRQCVRHIQKNYPAGQPVSCESWINGLPRFLALFPPGYAAGLYATDPDSKGFGWWGQFISKDGTLNAKHAEQLRRTGKFPYDRKHGECRLDELAAHIGTQ